jgi:glycosyltransferase involved in cell wall biosynthesis
MLVIDFSENFPNKYKPILGEHVYQLSRKLSEYSEVNVFVPLRFVPTRELCNSSIIQIFKSFYRWFYSLVNTKNIIEEKFKVFFLPYLSSPRPYLPGLDMYIIRYLIFFRVRKILKNKKPDLIYCHWFYPCIYICTKIAEYYNIPLILDNHESLHQLKDLYPKYYKKLLLYIEKANVVVVHSGYNENVLKEEAKLNNLKLRKVKKIFLGQNFIPDSKPKIPHSDRIELVTIAHLANPKKNIDILINAIEKVKKHLQLPVHLNIVGDGPLRNNYEELVKELKLYKVITFLGRKIQLEIEKLLEESDIFILPSFPEPFGVVFIEALAKGVPIISCIGNGGGEELIKLGNCGILVQPESIEDLTNAIIELANDNVKRMNMSKVGKAIVTEYFTWGKNAESRYRLIKETVEEFKRTQN